jgi:hypothetical protein
MTIGAITERVVQYTELLYAYFWHDVKVTITGCYEDTAMYFDNSQSIINYPKIMDYVTWMLAESQKRGLLNLRS